MTLKIKFIYPKFDKFLDTYPDLAQMPAIAAAWSFKMPPALGIPILAERTPSDIDWHLQDQNVEEINFDDDSDLIAISYFTPQAGYAYEIGDEFMRIGKIVVAGGMHPSMMPEEASRHCNSLCIGEADTVWPNIIRDFRGRQLKPRYKACQYPQPSEIASPVRNVFNEEKYDWNASLISITRGCPHSCSWCNIPLYQGREIRFRPIDAVAADIQKLSGKELYITDDIITWNRESINSYVRELCDRIKDHQVRMFLSGSPAMNSNADFLESIAEAGCKNMYVVFGSDTFSKMFYQKNKAVWSKCADLVIALEDLGIRFFGSFSLGYDFAGEEQFDLILEFCQKCNVRAAEFFIATPFPNTPFWLQLRQECRLANPVNWKSYNSANVVFRPKLITEEKLLGGFLYLWKEFYKNADYREYLSSFPVVRRKADGVLKFENSPKNS